MMTSDSEKRAAMTLVLMAAFADDHHDDRERAAVRHVAESLGAGAQPGGLNVWKLYQEVLAKRTSVADIARELPSREARLLAYEMAVGVCDTDGPPNAAEQVFLQEVRNAFSLSTEPAATRIEAEGSSIANDAVPVPPDLPAPAAATVPTLAPVDQPAVDKMIVNYAILNGALELLPQSLASMAIVPLQMKMVYRVGKQHGYELDRGHIRDFLAAAGVGMTSQAVEGYARKLLGGLAGKMLGGGGLLGGLGRSAARAGTGVAMTFATTYALGHLAARYYAGGRKMDMKVLQDTYTRLLADGQKAFGLHASDVEQRASTLKPGDVINLVRST